MVLRRILASSVAGERSQFDRWKRLGGGPAMRAGRAPNSRGFPVERSLFCPLETVWTFPGERRKTSVRAVCDLAARRLAYFFRVAFEFFRFFIVLAKGTLCRVRSRFLPVSIENINV